MPDLSPLPGANVQWWFLQGTLDLPGHLGHRFMAACFQVHAPSDDVPTAHMLLLHVMDGAGRRICMESRITPGVADAHRVMALYLARAHLPAALAGLLVGLHMRKAQAAARRDGIEITAGPDIRVAPFVLAWDGFVLAQQGETLHLRLPLGARPADLCLIPERPWLDERGDRLDSGLPAGFAYQCCPRLAVRGSVDGQPVRGRAWFDRQWGPFEGWFFAGAPAGLRPLGWDWFGLSFETGEDILAMRHHVAGGDLWGDGFALLFDGTGPVRLRGGFERRVLGNWRSPRSGISYPVRPRLRLPALDAEIAITPVAEDQEIPVFGAPAIWEGAVTADGQIGGRRVSGGGRMELFGYGYAPSIGAYLAWMMRGRFGL
jgi:predicted secreted hydrolase